MGFLICVWNAGSFGQVIRIKDRLSGVYRAAKMFRRMKRNNAQEKNIYNEIEVLKFIVRKAQVKTYHVKGPSFNCKTVRSVRRRTSVLHHHRVITVNMRL